MLSRKAKLEMEKTLTRAKFPYLIEITYIYNDDTEANPHRDILRYVNADNDVTFENNTFSAGYFSVKPPQKTQKGFTDASISISAIDQTWIERVRSTNKRAKIRFVATISYVENSTEVIEPIEDMEFTLTNASTDGAVLNFTMKFDELLDIKVPYEECNDRVCPALV